MPDELQLLLKSYPRERPPLSKRHQELYVSEYQRSRSGGKGLPGLVATMESWMHRQVAGSEQGERVLEIGAGTLNHVAYERNPSEYDVVEPFRELWENSSNRKKVTAIYSDISEVPADRRYDRIISVAVLEHLTDLPSILSQCALLLAKGGSLRAGIPSEGGFLWSLGWRATTGVSYRLRTGLSYERVMRHEHVNCSDEIIAITRYLFRNLTIRRFPLPGKHFSLYTSLIATDPSLQTCNELLRKR
jgi:SAM-dependent methyltransferase